MSSSISRRGSSISTKDENLSTNVHFKWDSIRKFVYIAFAFSTSTAFSELFGPGQNSVRIYDYMLIQLVVGIEYLFIEFFIKQYTKRLDFMTYLNPNLKGIISGSILQVSLLAISTSTDLADVVRYLISNLSRPPIWEECHKKNQQLNCVTTEDISPKCLYNKTLITQTSNHFFYDEGFSDIDSSTATSRTFISAVVWMANFFCSTLSDAVLVRIMRISFYWSTVSSILTVIFIVIYNSTYRYQALLEILNITSPATFDHAIDHVAQTYSVGLIGLHDYSSMSPYTMIDNTVVIFTIIYTLYAFCKALTSRILILKMEECIEFNYKASDMNSHYFMFVVTPLSMHFLPLRQLHTFNLFLTTTIQCGTNVAMITVTIARMLHNEFRSIRIVYIVGLLCSMGFLASLTMTMTILPVHLFYGILLGLRASVLFLGFYKVAIIMYIYGLKNFTTDIHFWLGFKPTKFWTLNWMITPIVLLFFFIKKMSLINQIQLYEIKYAAFGWFGISLLLVMAVNSKVLIHYLQKNCGCITFLISINLVSITIIPLIYAFKVDKNVLGIFRAHPKYGPLDRDYLQKRKTYSESLKHKVCKHHCMVYDESYTDCEHIAVVEEYDSSLLSFDSSSSLLLRGGKSMINRFFSRSSY